MLASPAGRLLGPHAEAAGGRRDDVRPLHVVGRALDVEGGRLRGAVGSHTEDGERLAAIEQRAPARRASRRARRPRDERRARSPPEERRARPAAPRKEHHPARAGRRRAPVRRRARTA